MSYYIILHFLIGIICWFILCYLKKKKIIVSDIFDSISPGLLGPIMIVVLIIYIIPHDKIIIGPKNEKID